MDGPIPRIPRYKHVPEAVHDFIVVGNRRDASGASLGVEDRPGVDVEKIRSRQCLGPDTRRGTPPYGVVLYIECGREVSLLDEKAFEAMPEGPDHTTLIKVSGGSE